MKMDSWMVDGVWVVECLKFSERTNLIGLDSVVWKIYNT